MTRVDLLSPPSSPKPTVQLAGAGSAALAGAALARTRARTRTRSVTTVTLNLKLNLREQFWQGLGLHPAAVSALYVTRFGSEPTATVVLCPRPFFLGLVARSPLAISAVAVRHSSHLSSPVAHQPLVRAPWWGRWRVRSESPSPRCSPSASPSTLAACRLGLGPGSGSGSGVGVGFSALPQLM